MVAVKVVAVRARHRFSPDAHVQELQVHGDTVLLKLLIGHLPLVRSHTLTAGVKHRQGDRPK